MQWLPGRARGLIVAALVVALPRLAAAQGDGTGDAEARARARFEAGVRHMRASEWPAAEREFRASVELLPTQAGLFNLGAAVLAQDRPLEALDIFDEYAERFADVATEDQLAEARRMRERAYARLCRVTVEVSPEGARVAVDGEPVGRAPLEEALLLEAGEHRFAARLDGYEERELTRTLEEGCVGEAVAISLERADDGRGDGRPLLLTVPRPRPEEGPRRTAATAGWVLLAAAGGAAVAAAITGGLTLSLHQEFGQMAMAEDDDWGPLQEEGRALALTTDILIGVAVAAAAVCVPLLVYGYGRPAEERR